MLRAVTRWLNISVCLGIELFSPSVLVILEGSRRGGHQTSKSRELRLAIILCFRDSVREGSLSSLLGSFSPETIRHKMVSPFCFTTLNVNSFCSQFTGNMAFHLFLSIPCGFVG